MKHYSPTGRRNHGRHLKRLLDTWDLNGSTTGPTPRQIYDDDDYDDDDDDDDRWTMTDEVSKHASVDQQIVLNWDLSECKLQNTFLLAHQSA
jgi:hypothetical protein